MTRRQLQLFLNESQRQQIRARADRLEGLSIALQGSGIEAAAKIREQVS